jgi:hypothetical protein
MSIRSFFGHTDFGADWNLRMILRIHKICKKAASKGSRSGVILIQNLHLPSACFHANPQTPGPSNRIFLPAISATRITKFMFISQRGLSLIGYFFQLCDARTNCPIKLNPHICLRRTNSVKLNPQAKNH